MHVSVYKYGGRRVAASTPPPKHVDISKGTPLSAPKPPSDQFRARVSACW